jgi:iron-sulfur cluster repair protein YtfE (RIC family)
MVAVVDGVKGEIGSNLRDLITSIEAHHVALRAALPRLEELVDQVARDRLAPIRSLDRMQREFAFLADLLRTHLAEQEAYLFPMVRDICRSLDESGWVCHLGDATEELIDEAACDDREAVTAGRLLDRFAREMEREGDGSLVVKLVKGLRELHADLEEHVHLETHFLFPAIRELLRGNHDVAERLLESSRSRIASPGHETERMRNMLAGEIGLVPLAAPVTPLDEIIVADQETG